MCGILGVFNRKGIDDVQFYKQIESIYHRGPDDGGSWFNQAQTLGLASRRLAIRDLSEKGHMPMFSDDGNYVIVFNGEIYNYSEIKKQLLNLGYSFRSNSDTECVLYAYAEWGVNCLKHFNGMFAIAIFDTNKQELFLARDRSGEKPLYYWKHEGGMSFSSELKQLLLDDNLPRVMNNIALKQYLEDGFTKGKESFIKDVYKLQAANYLIYNIKNSDIKIVPYWDVPKYINNNKSKEDLLEELDSLLSNAVKRQLVSDVPIGVLLSGGVDSSLITSYASENSMDRIKTFHISFPGFGKLDESFYARKVSEYYDTEHYELSGNDLEFSMIDEILDYCDEPLGDSSLLPTYLVSKLTKKYVTVALGGDGGDELFGGYTSYANFLNENNFNKYIPDYIKTTTSNLAKLLPIGLKGRNFLINCEGDKYKKFSNNRLFDDYSIKKIISNTYYPQMNIECETKIFHTNDFIFDVTKSDFKNYLAEDILVKVDRSSMASSLEMRAPWLDKDLIEFAFANVSSNFKVNKNELKILPKALLKNKMPVDFDLSRKQGFSIPLNEWISNKWFDEFIEEINNFPKFLDKNEALIMCNNVKKGYSNSSKLFALVMLSKWINKYNINY
jgi:asparagine synthase (glutamine-hydrolysing)